MNHVSFGSLLKEARISKGYKLVSVARQLHIRPDILRAIEESDFDNMPPRGYTRNMINAYARFLNLNASKLTRMYLDEVYAHQISSAHQHSIQTAEEHRTYAASRAARQTGELPRVSRSAHSTRAGRDMYYSNEPAESSPRRERARRSGSSHEPIQNTTSFHPSRRPIINEGKYGNMVSESPSRFSQPQSKKPFLIGGVIVLLLAILVGMFACSGKEEETDNIPVTGVESTPAGEAEPVEVAPTDFTLTYQVAEGSDSWIEVYIDDEVQEASEVVGPKSAEYTSSTTIRFISSQSSGVTVTIDGEKQTLEPNENGIVDITFKFSDVLEAWNKAHPQTTSNTSSGDTSSSGDSQNSSSNNGEGTSSNSGSTSTTGTSGASSSSSTGTSGTSSASTSS